MFKRNRDAQLAEGELKEEGDDLYGRLLGR